MVAWGRSVSQRSTIINRSSSGQALTSVANDTAGLYVEGDLSHCQPRLIAKAGDEIEKMPNVGKVRDQTHRSSNGTGALMAPVLHQSNERSEEHTSELQSPMY